MKNLDIARVASSVKIEDDWHREVGRWPYYNQANCYQFALQIMMDFDRLQPGELSGITFEPEHRYTDEELLECVKSDLALLGFTMEETTLEEPVKDGTWKIAVMNCNPRLSNNYDYHFLRQNVNQQWMQLFYGEQHPTRMDESYELITDPSLATYDFRYMLVGYFVVKPKQLRLELK